MKILGSLSKGMGYVAAVAIIVLMLVVVSDVCGRYFFNHPITGASELAAFLMIIVVFPALAWAALEGKHVKVDLLIERFPQRVQVITDCITMIVALGMYIIITWQSIRDTMDVHDVTSMIRLPHAPFHWIMVLGLVVFCLSIVVLAIGNITKAVKR